MSPMQKCAHNLAQAALQAGTAPDSLKLLQACEGHGVDQLELLDRVRKIMAPVMKSDVRYYFWNAPRDQQGQIVQMSIPQVPGRAEGYEGRAIGLRLYTDASDRSWRLEYRGKEIARGASPGNPPTVAEALKLAWP